MSAARFHVRGKVQGVWYRDSTRREATRLGLRGHARNLSDGSVEVVAVGESDALAALERWLWQGPQLARVDAVERGDTDPGEVPEGFTIG